MNTTANSLRVLIVDDKHDGAESLVHEVAGVKVLSMSHEISTVAVAPDKWHGATGIDAPFQKCLIEVRVRRRIRSDEGPSTVFQRAVRSPDE